VEPTDVFGDLALCRIQLQVVRTRK